MSKRMRPSNEVDKACLAGLQGLIDGVRMGCLFVACKRCCQQPAPVLSPLCKGCVKELEEARHGKIIGRVLETIRKMR